MNDYYENMEKILKKVEAQVTFIVAKMKLSEKIDPEDVFFDNQEFMQVMNISKRTAQEWRIKKVIPFSQIGNKIYYSLADIKKLLKANYHAKN